MAVPPPPLDVYSGLYQAPQTSTSIGTMPHVSGLHSQSQAQLHIGAMQYGLTFVQQDSLNFVAQVFPQVTGSVTFTLTGPGDPIVLGYTVQLDGSFLVTVLGGIPLQSYTVSVYVPSVGVTLTAFIVWQAEAEPLGYKILEALTYAFGKQVQELGGVPCTHIINDLDIYDTIVQVKSTLGFPRIGWIRIGAMLVEYISKTSESFTLRTPALRYPIVQAGTRVLLAVEKITPDGANTGTESYGG